MLSCTSRKHITGQTTISVLDFSKYSNRGFVFSPYTYDGDYDPVGMITIYALPGAYLDEKSSNSKGEWMIEIIHEEDVLDTLYQKATAMGANAIISLRIENVPYSESVGVYKINMTGLKVEGFAIRRKL